MSEFVLLLGIILILPLSGCNCHTGSDEADRKSISEVVDFGIIGQGQSATYRAWLRNPTGEVFRVTDVETSCECLDARLSDQVIPAHGKVVGEFVYAGEQHPEFVGCLEATVTLKGADRVVGVVTVSLEAVALKPNSPISELPEPKTGPGEQDTSNRQKRVFFAAETAVRDTPTHRSELKKGTP